jgi:hypothetical protein
MLAALPDELLVQLLEHLSPCSLAALATASRACYAFCALEELWRAATLEEFNGGAVFALSWRHTFRAATLAARAAREDRQPPPPEEVPPPARVSCAGVYSDVLFAPHRCAHFPLEPRWLAGDTVPREAGLSVDDFIARYERCVTSRMRLSSHTA